MKIRPLSKVFRSSSWSLTTLAWASVMALGFSSPEARAALIAQESFDYTPGSGLDTQSGGFGWTGDWVVQGTAPIVINIVNDNLNYPFGLPDSEGNAIGRGTGSRSALGKREYDVAGTSAMTGGEIWFSFLVNPSVANTGSDFRVYGVASDNITTPTPTSLIDLGLGAYALGSTSAMTARIGTQDSADSLLLTPGLTQLVVGRINLPTSDFNEAASVALWVDPSTGDLAGDVNNISITVANLNLALGPNVTSLAQLNQFAFRYGVAWAGVFDEIRIAPDAFTVLGIPEPTRGILIALGALTLMARRRR